MEVPKTPRTPPRPRGSRRLAPEVKTPNGERSSTPASCSRDTKKCTPLHVSRKGKENSSRAAPSEPPRARKMEKGVSGQDADVPTLKVQTSREIAELVALTRSIDQMKVVEVSGTTIVDRQAFEELMNLSVPVVFRRYAAEWKCVKKWSDIDYLSEVAAEEDRDFPHRRYRQFTAHSTENGRLHLTDGKSKARPVSIKEFLENTDEIDKRDGLYLLGIHAVGKQSMSYCPVQPHADDKNSVPPLSRDVPEHIEILEWYADVLRARQKGESPIKYDHQQFFLAKGYAHTDLHYDSYDNFYVAVSGTRRWTLASPNASRWLIDSAGGKLKSGSSAAPHNRSFPRGSPAQIYPFAFVELYPGDVLFVPNCWWHLVESIPGAGGYSCAFNFFFSMPPDEVFGEFQARLSATDTLVNELQAECRSKIARAYEDDKSRKEIAGKILIAPGKLPQELWDQLVTVALKQDIMRELESLHSVHERNSTSIWRMASGQHHDSNLPLKVGTRERADS